MTGGLLGHLSSNHNKERINTPAHRRASLAFLTILSGFPASCFKCHM